MKGPDLSNKVFGRLTVIKEVNIGLFECSCICGNIKTIRRGQLTTGKTKSCGCLQIENRIKHGHGIRSNRSPEYVSWYSMKQRVTNPNHKYYDYYGGRGIIIISRWDSFENFLEDMGPSGGLTLDRKDPNGNYEKDNCKWSTRAEQVANRRISKH